MSTTPIDLSRRTSNRAAHSQAAFITPAAPLRQPERAHDGFVPPSRSTSSAANIEAAHGIDFMELAYSPNRDHEANPLRGFVSDELYTVLRSNDLINEKGLRDFIIRSVFKQMKDEQRMKTVDAIGRLQEIYPYLQIDTIRKIVYRISPGNQRKGMI